MKVVAGASAFAIAGLAIHLSAQAPKKASRTPWGDPNLQGNYTNLYEDGTPLERPKEFDGRTLDDVRGDELARLKDPALYVFGANSLFQDELPAHKEIREAAQRAKTSHPVTQLTEGWVAGLALEQALKSTPWPPTPEKMHAAMSNLHVDTKGLRGGPIEWTRDNHFRTRHYYRVWHWDATKGAIVRVQDWQAIEVKR